MSPATRSRLCLLGAAALFSTAGAAVKACSLGSWEVAGLRALFAASALLLALPTARRGWSGRAALVAIAYAATVILFVRANKLTTAANAIFLQGSSPLYILLLGPWLLREPVRRRDGAFLIALALGLGLFFVGLAPARTAPDPLAGNLCALLAGVTAALMTVGLRWLGRDAGSTAVPAVVMGNLLAFAVAAPFALPLPSVSGPDLGVLLYLGVIQIALAYVLFLEGLRHVGALAASLLMFMEPVLSPVWAWLVHGEDPGGWAIAGGLVILSATAARAVYDARRPIEVTSLSAG